MNYSKKTILTDIQVLKYFIVYGREKQKKARGGPAPLPSPVSTPLYETRVDFRVAPVSVQSLTRYPAVV